MDRAQFLTGGGIMGARVQAHDWSSSPLGEIESWPQPLRISLGIVLNSRFPAYLAWGPDFISIYNDAYSTILGSKREALGRPMAEVWPEIWDELGPILTRALAGEASYFEDRPFTLERNQYPERTWWTLSYSPVRDEAGDVGGVCVSGSRPPPESLQPFGRAFKSTWATTCVARRVPARSWGP